MALVSDAECTTLLRLNDFVLVVESGCVIDGELLTDEERTAVGDDEVVIECDSD